MKLNKFALALAAAISLPTLAYAGTDTVAVSFDRAFINESYTNAAKQDQVAASFDRAFGNETIINAYLTKSDQVIASFGRDLYREPVTTAAAPARADSLDFINSALNLGSNAVVASFEHDLMGNAATGVQDSILASFERDLYREPVAVTAAITQGEDAFVINEPDAILANFYRELHWAPGASAVYVR